jgi:hypothetical protein
MIVAMGTVNYLGGFGAALNIASVTWNAVHQWWEITLDGINYYHPNYVTVVSAICRTGVSGYAEVDSVSGKLVVKMFDADGTSIQEGFSFVIFSK